MRPLVGRRQAKGEEASYGLAIGDGHVRYLGSGPEVTVNGEPVTTVDIHHGDRIRTGPYEFRVQIDSPRPPDDAQKALVKKMQAQVADCAKNLDIAAETVASKRELSSLINSGTRDSRVLQGWRRELIGEKLLRML